MTLFVRVAAPFLAGYFVSYAYRMVKRRDLAAIAVHLAMIAGYMLFGTAADRRTRRGKSALPLMMGGVAASAASLGHAAEAYPWALAIVLAAQVAGLAWLWSGRRLLA
ncbi:MAG: hypothetical protein ACT4P4_15335 [Betaproteobacteria bacterium]